jgi:hypothetical protein
VVPGILKPNIRTKHYLTLVERMFRTPSEYSTLHVHGCLPTVLHLLPVPSPRHLLWLHGLTLQSLGQMCSRISHLCLNMWGGPQLELGSTPSTVRC